jgi:excisionase family DNA binding protein
MDTKEAATLLQVSPRRVTALAKSGKLPGEKIADEWQFRFEDVASWKPGRPGRPKAVQPVSEPKSPEPWVPGIAVFYCR